MTPQLPQTITVAFFSAVSVRWAGVDFAAGFLVAGLAAGSGCGASALSATTVLASVPVVG